MDYMSNVDKSLDRGRLYLSFFTEEQIQDISRYIATKGRLAVSEACDDTRQFAPIKFMGLFSPQLIKKHHIIEKLAYGMSIVWMNTLMKPQWGNDEYEKILIQTFGLPDALAAKLAKNIETENNTDGLDLSDSDKAIDPATGRPVAEGKIEDFFEGIVDWSRRTANKAAAILHLDWEIDQNAKFDKDFLYEVVKFAEVVSDLSDRSELIATQANINLGIPVGGLGDPDESVGDVIDHHLGKLSYHAFAPTGDPAWWPAGLRKLVSAKKTSAVKTLKAIHTTPQVISASGKPVASVATGLKTRLTGLLSKKPTLAFALGALGGATPIGLGALALKGVFKRMMAKKAAGGDPEVGDSVRELYGEVYGDAFETGDVESLVGEILLDSFHPATTGDPHLDDAIIGDLVDNEIGDIDTYGPEIGGVISNWRKNRAIKAYKRKVSRKQRKATRQTDRQAAKAMRKAGRDYNADDYRAKLEERNANMQQAYEDNTSRQADQLDTQDFERPEGDDQAYMDNQGGLPQYEDQGDNGLPAYTDQE